MDGADPGYGLFLEVRVRSRRRRLCNDGYLRVAKSDQDIGPQVPHGQDKTGLLQRPGRLEVSQRRKVA